MTENRAHEKRTWSDPTILSALRNPASNAQEINHKIPELTFLGAENQPDFGIMYINFYPGETIIELKSLKLYIVDFRNRKISYERLIDTFFKDLIAVYNPKRLRIVAIFNPRGGISSKIIMDSDWGILGGKEVFKNWTSYVDEW